MNIEYILSILETIPKDILIKCIEKLILKNKHFKSLEKQKISSTIIYHNELNKMYSSTKDFSKDLVLTYETVLDLSKMYGDTGIANRKRQETYKKAVSIVKDLDTNLNLLDFTNELDIFLTEKPKKLMNELLTEGKVILENKPPYNGVTIKHGKIIGDTDINLEGFKNLSVLAGIGIGLGDTGIRELVKMKFKNIEELKTIYDENKFANFRKGLQGPLCKYFEGKVRIQKMSRAEATKWKDTISNIVDNAIINILPEISKKSIQTKHKIAGSYARNQEEIGDIDYVVVVNDDNYLYKIMINILDQLTEVTDIGDLPVELDSVIETPSRPVKGSSRYSTFIKMWFNVGTLKTKIEIYGYSNTEFCFPYFARAGEVKLQKKVKLRASKMGYKLGPWGLEKKDTDQPITEDPEQVELIREKIGKDKIETIRELFNFLEFN